MTTTISAKNAEPSAPVSITLPTPAPPSTPAAPPAAKAPSLSERAMLVDLDAGRWGARVKDTEAAREIAQSRGGDDEYYGAFRRLMPKDALKPYDNAVGRLERIHNWLTLPWKRGSRILASAGYAPYRKQTAEAIAAVEDEAENFLAKYQAHIDAAARGQGSAFDRSAYPSVAKLRERLKVRIEYSNVPDAGDFRVTWPQEWMAQETDRITAQMEATAEERVRGTLRDVAKRIEERVGHMAAKLTAYRVTEDGVENGFRDSLVDNVRELVEILPALNVAADPQIDAITERMRAELLRFSPDTLRQSEAARAKVAAAADAIVAQMADYL